MAGIFKDPYAGSPTVGQVLSQLGTNLSGLGSLFVQPGLRDPGYGFNLENKPIPTVGPSATSPTTAKGVIGPTRDIYEVPGTGWFDRRSGRFLGKGGTSAPAPAPASTGGGARTAAPATSPNTITQRADDTYKQLLSQYGGQTGLSQLAGQTSLPTGFTPEGGKQAASLKDYYAAQQAVGAKNIGDIISSMGYTGPMAEWAKANPMLAQREFAKRQAAGGGAPTLGGDLTGFGVNANFGAGLPTNAYDFSAPSPITPMAGFGLPTGTGSVSTPGYSAPPVSQGVFEPFKYGTENFGNPANPVVAPPADTQRVLNAPFNEAMAQAGRGLNPDNYTSQNPSVSKKASDFLGQSWLQGFGGNR